MKGSPRYPKRVTEFGYVNGPPTYRILSPTLPALADQVGEKG